MEALYSFVGFVVVWICIGLLWVVVTAFVIHRIKRKRWFVFLLDWFGWNFRRRSISKKYARMKIGALESVHRWLDRREHKTRYTNKHLEMVKAELKRRESDNG